MARYDLRIPEDEVGELTLAEFDALVQRKKAEDNRIRLNAGVVAATIQNCTPGDPNREPASPLDFVPDWAKDHKVDLRSMTPEQQRDHIQAMFDREKSRALKAAKG